MSTIEERVAALESALASMTAAEKRIVELPAASSVANDDFVALDGVANGSRRFAASNLGGKAEVMTEAEWDDLPDSKLTDGKVYALSGVSPSTQDNPLWQKLGFAALDTQADDCSDAINELNTGLTNINSKFADVNGTLISSTGNTVLQFPSGYTYTTCAVVSLMFYLGGIWYTCPHPNFSKLNSSLRSDGIYIYNEHADLYGKDIKIVLRKL